MQYPLDFYTSHNQFYIQDGHSSGETDSNTFWTESAYNDRLAVEEGILGVGTECYGPVKGEIIILDKENKDFVIDAYDHIVEAGLKIPSGIIQVIDCPTSTVSITINIEPGSYKARIYSSNLVSVNGDDGDDFYKIEIWPSLEMDRIVLKRYE